MRWKMRSRRMPALLTRMSIRPKASSAAFTIRSALAGSLIDSVEGIASPPAFLISFTTACAGVESAPSPSTLAPMSQTTTRAPSCAMSSATPRPMPRPAPVTMHLCRGNYKSTFMGSGMSSYEAVQEVLFDRIKVHGYFMEYDTARAGGVEPLKYLPKGRIAVLGLVTSKSGALESKNTIKRRIEEAARFTGLDQLCLSPQCGFASTEEGNILAEEEQWAKLRTIVEVAREVWG